jgi:uncharacterized protein YhjY with autotransporter beta-barrel domain
MARARGNGDNGRSRLRPLLASSSLAALLVGGGTPAYAIPLCSINDSGVTIGAVTNSAAINCISIVNSTVNGDVTNTNAGTLTPLFKIPTGIAINASTINGAVVNNGAITATTTSGIGITVFNNATVTAGITNTGTISANLTGSSIVGVSTFSGGISNSGTISAGNNGIFLAAVLTHSGVDLGISSFSGGITNSGTISAGTNGIDLFAVSAFSGGIVNKGTISAGGNGIELFAGDTFSGGITNGGTISGYGGIDVSSVGTFSNGITNSGTISATGFDGAAIGVDAVGDFSGGITNTGTISAFHIAIDVGTVVNFSGGITNSGTINASGFSAGGIVVTGTRFESFSGGITNSGTIIASGIDSQGIGVKSIAQFGSSSAGGGVTNSGMISGGIDVYSVSAFWGGISNSGTISGGIGVVTVSTFSGGITNSGTMSVGYDILVESVSTFSGGIVNSAGGVISASHTGIYVTGVSAFSGGITNSGTISASGAYAAGIIVADFSTFSGNIVNSGTITAGGNGIDVYDITGSGYYSAADFISNAGKITAGANGIVVSNIEQFGAGSAGGGIVNSGTIAAGFSGIAVLGVSTFLGGITNSGTISAAGNGIFLAALQTHTGAILGISSFSGGIANSGTISAGATGIFISGVSTFSGGVSNSGTISAAGIGIDVGDYEVLIHFGTRTITVVSGVSAFSGGITNSGTISAGATGILVNGVSTFSGGITNSGTVSGKVGILVTNSGAVSVFDSGTIIGTGGTAVDLSHNSAGNTFTLGPGYSISGNVLGQGSDTFQLGGTGSAPFNLSAIGAAQQYRGFTAFNVVSGAWTVSNTFSQSQAWNVDGGTLAGTGSLKSVNVNTGGTLQPGTPGTPGTAMSITGNLAFQAGAFYLVQVNPATASLANVTGTATLAGTVQAAFAPGSYVAKQYDILQAGLLSGTFSALVTTSLPAGFTASLSYDPTTNVLLNLTAVLGQQLPTGGLNLNQQNVATSLDNFFNGGGTLTPSFLTIFGLSGGSLANALSRLDGEVATDAERGAFKLMDQFLGLMLDPFVDGRSGAGWPSGGGHASGFAPEQQASFPPDVALGYASVLKAPPRPAEFDQRWSAWGAGFGGSSAANGDPVVGSTHVTTSDYGFAAGMDYRFSPDTVAGFALAGGGTNWGLAQGLGSGRSDAFQIGVYGTTRFGPAYLAAALDFSNYWMSTNRFAPVGDQLTANFDAQSYGVRVEAGYRYAMPVVAVTPYAAMQALSYHSPNYSETDLTGGGFGLNYNAMTATDTRSELGSRFDAPTMLASMPLTLRGRLAWAHDWVSNNPALEAAFQALPGASFTVNGAPLPKDSALASAGAVLRITPTLSLAAKFDGEFADGSQTYAGTGTLRYTW